GGGNAPEDQDAKQHAADIEGIGDVVAQRVAQDHREKDVERDDADKGRRDPFDGEIPASVSVGIAQACLRPLPLAGEVVSHRRCDTGGGSLRTRATRGNTPSPPLPRKSGRGSAVLAGLAARPIIEADIMKIYLAGPDVFLPDALDIGKQKVAICERYGVRGLYPLDTAIDLSAR
ncbi:hypothetical protein KXW36_000355, partial [Aspergillus fumigatus]